MQNISLKDWPIYSLFLLPVAIISGPFLSDLFLIIIDLWFLHKIITDKTIQEKYIKNYLFYFFLLFNFYLVLVSLNSENTLISLKSSFFYFRFYLFAFAIWFIFDNYKITVKYFYYSICCAIVLIVLSAQYDLIIIKDFFKNINPSQGELYRVSGFFGDELIMGGVLKSFFVIFLVLFSYFNFFQKKIINIISILILLWIVSFTILISGERTSIFTYLCFCLFAGLILKKKIDLVKIILISSILMILLFLSFDKLRERIIGDTFKQITNNELIEDSYGNKFKLNKDKFTYLSIHHDAHARTAIKMFLAKPLIGHGPNNFRNICKEYEYNQFSCTTHPHNIYLQLLSETGLIGACFLFFAVMYFILIIIKNFKKDKNSSLKILLIYLLIYFIPFVPSGNFFNNAVNINFYLLIGIFLMLMDHSKKNEKC